MAQRTLDVPEPQVLIHYPDDPGGFTWHHRVLLARAGQAGVWVGLSPDLGPTVYDLTTQVHVVLARGAEFPAEQRPRTYAFDPISRAELDLAKRRARIQAQRRGGGGRSLQLACRRPGPCTARGAGGTGRR